MASKSRKRSKKQLNEKMPLRVKVWFWVISVVILALSMALLWR